MTVYEQRIKCRGRIRYLLGLLVRWRARRRMDKLVRALRYQSPMRGHIASDPQRAAFVHDLVSMPYEDLCRKWAKRPTLKLLFQKYVWGNCQKVWLWNLLNRDQTK